MESVKKFITRYSKDFQGNMVLDPGGFWVLAGDAAFRDKKLMDKIEALQQRLTVQDQRVDELHELLESALFRLETFIEDEREMPITSMEVLRDAVQRQLAAKAEPQCLLCLEKKTVPGNIPGGFVKDCPDCCGEEG